MANQLQKPEQKQWSLRQLATHPQNREMLSSSLGGWMDGDSFISQLLTSLSRDDIRPCTEESKFKALQLCAALQMLPSVQHVALIPRKQNNAMEVTVMPQWQGYQSLMLRHPEVQDVQAVLVHVSDRLTYNATTGQVDVHEFNPLDPNRKFEKIEDLHGGYLKVVYRPETRRADKYHFVKAETIKKARSCAQTQNIWQKWFEEMCLKTIFRNAYARRVVPIDPLVAKNLEKANQIDDETLGNDPDRVTSATVVDRPAQPQLSRTQQLAQQFSPVPSIDDHEQHGTVIEQAPPRETKKAAGKKKAEQDAEPESIDVPEPQFQVPFFFEAYAAELAKCKNETQVLAAWNANVNANKELDPSEREIGDDMRERRLAELKCGTVKGGLFDQ